MQHRLIALTVTGFMAAGCGAAAGPRQDAPAQPRQDIPAEPNTFSQPAAPPAAAAAGRGEPSSDTAGRAEPDARDPSHTLGRESPPFIGSLERSGGETSRKKDTGEMMTADSAELHAPGPEMSGEGTAGRQQRSALQAGEVDDNLRWQEYLEFVEQYEGPPVRTTDLRDRQVITVVDQEGKPVPNARVTFRPEGSQAGITHITYADGRTILFPMTRGAVRERLQQDGITATAERDSFVSSTLIPADSGDGSVTITLEGAMEYGRNVPLDVLFLLDSTGSMADEIHRIKSTLHAIAREVSTLPASPDLRFGMVAYRDRGDDYVTRLHDFEGDVERFQDAISSVEAEGGGDYAESLNQALHEAVNDMRWRQDAVRLIFLVADAPPHLDYPQDEDYAVEMERPRQRGIKIFSVASSGLDDRGEYIFRQLAQQTMGKFIFILYPTGPQGSLQSPHSVEQYTVNRLDSLIIGLIREELRHLDPGSQSGMRMKEGG